MPFKLIQIIFFPEIFFFKKNCVCKPYLNFSDLLSEKHIFFLFSPINMHGKVHQNEKGKAYSNLPIFLQTLLAGTAQILYVRLVLSDDPD